MKDVIINNLVKADVLRHGGNGIFIVNNLFTTKRLLELDWFTTHMMTTTSINRILRIANPIIRKYYQVRDESKDIIRERSDKKI